MGGRGGASKRTISDSELSSLIDEITAQDPYSRVTGVIPYVGRDIQQEVMQVTISERLWREAIPRQVSLDSLVTVQHSVQPERLKGMISLGDISEDLPIRVVIFKGQMMIRDGNHRATLAKLRGRGKIWAKVINLDTLET